MLAKAQVTMRPLFIRTNFEPLGAGYIKQV
jgi:hypothetical protein